MSLGTPDDICLDANPAYCRIIGRPRETLIGRSFAELPTRTTLGRTSASTPALQQGCGLPDGEAVSAARWDGSDGVLDCLSGTR